MSGKERDRLKVLHQVQQGQLLQREAALQLGLSERGFRKLLSRFRQHGDAGVAHQLRGKKSNRRLKEKTARRTQQLIGKHYADFGPTLASEYLSEHHGIDLSPETVRRLMIQAGLWQAKRKKVRKIHCWRARRNCVGELVQWDTSKHAWLEDRGPQQMYLIALIDDASSQLYARFVKADSTRCHMEVLWGYLERYGRPVSVYTDRAGLFEPAHAPGWKQEPDEPGEKNETQLGRAFRELGIEWIAAYSPQAKGRVERCFGTLQDRLIKGLRVAGVSSLEQANQYLEQVFLPQWSRRFECKPAHDVDAHRELTEHLELASVLSHVEQRQVSNDYTVQWRSEKWQIPAGSVHAGLKRRKVWVEQRLNGDMAVRLEGRTVLLEKCEAKPVEPVSKADGPVRRHIPKPGSSRWMDHFRVEGNEAWKAYREQTGESSAPLRSPSGLPPRR